MSDIYVRRSYDDHNKKNPLRILFPILVVVLLAGTWWWLSHAHKPDAEGTEGQSSVSTSSSNASLAPMSTSSGQVSTPKSQAKAQRLFEQAQSLVGADELSDAVLLLDQVMETTTDPRLKSNARRVQGRVNVQLFLSAQPTEDKKTYVIQPGDSLDRIARKNGTTVDLIRKMNQIEGNLIYPGARLMLPVTPFEVQVDKSAREMDLVLNGKIFKRYSVGLGRFGKTPLGTFKTVVHQRNPDWTPPSGGIVPFGDPRNVLGTRWMSILDETQPELKGFGIHGTADRTSIGGETSNGCIRMLNEDVEEVYLLIPRGTKVIIHE